MSDILGKIAFGFTALVIVLLGVSFVGGLYYLDHLRFCA